MQNSAAKVESRITALLGGTAVVYSIIPFCDVDSLIASGRTFHLYFLNKYLRDTDENKLLAYIEQSKNLKGHKTFNFITYANDPIADSDCDTILESIRRYLDYDSMYLCIEFLTEQGLKTIAVSKILYFEYCERKIRIKTQHSQFFCNDTMKNVFSLVSGYAFAAPHKSFIVNLRHITSIKDYIVTMNDGSKIPLSQKRSRDFRTEYKSYLSKNNARIAKKVRK
ncbi:MAG: LytTR family transcriptional regulator DNA-binding domain-containing protein [Oscillospiraceae bacterium]|nr:LytTR family transcriptional regulator DNA-binding domain-containing protein [Oscillospiraceae bacterium]